MTSTRNELMNSILDYAVEKHLDSCFPLALSIWVNRFMFAVTVTLWLLSISHNSILVLALNGSIITFQLTQRIYEEIIYFSNKEKIHKNALERYKQYKERL
jgi:uncharacterized membrane protein